MTSPHGSLRKRVSRSAAAHFCWTSAAHSAALMTLVNSARNPSRMVLTMRLVSAELRLNHLADERRYASKGPLLVGAHQAGTAGDIGAYDGRATVERVHQAYDAPAAAGSSCAHRDRASNPTAHAGYCRDHPTIAIRQELYGRRGAPIPAPSTLTAPCRFTAS